MALKIRKNLSPAPPNECPLSKCMEVLKGAWTPNIIWFLSGGPRRFSELRVDIPKVSAKVLTARLRDLEAKGVLRREVKPTSPPSVEYSLTDLGEQLIPAINAIVDVGLKLKERRGVLYGARRKAAGKQVAAE
ncbi:MAG: winged helix-turn-helix transcriptional regulator [Kiloniellaceae bacterium]